MTTSQPSSHLVYLLGIIANKDLFRKIFAEKWTAYGAAPKQSYVSNNSEVVVHESNRVTRLNALHSMKLMCANLATAGSPTPPPRRAATPSSPSESIALLKIVRPDSTRLKCTAPTVFGCINYWNTSLSAAMASHPQSVQLAGQRHLSIPSHPHSVNTPYQQLRNRQTKMARRQES